MKHFLNIFKHIVAKYKMDNHFQQNNPSLPSHIFVIYKSNKGTKSFQTVSNKEKVNIEVLGKWETMRQFTTQITQCTTPKTHLRLS